MKEFGLTGLPVQRIENASATGSAAFREACLRGRGRPLRRRHGARLRQDDEHDQSSTRRHRAGGHGGRDPAGRRSSPCGRRAACTSAAPSRSISRAIAAKNFNNGALEPDEPAPGRPRPVTVEKVLGVAHGRVAADDDDVVPDRRRRRRARSSAAPDLAKQLRPGPAGRDRVIARRRCRRALRARPPLS